MLIANLYPRLAVVCTAIALFSIPSFTQTTDSRPRTVTPAIDSRGVPRLENEADVFALEAIKPPRKIGQFVSPALAKFDSMLLGAIDDRIGAPYVYGAEGPFAFDCSGFVWSAFQAAGFPFERSSARSLWSKFEPVAEPEAYKFGTLVFFNNLGHIGIVADENGFYHASRSHGVTYSPFNKYWSERIDGFRKVPVTALVAATE
jgi:peptidoglycan endopeptidase LytE